MDVLEDDDVSLLTDLRRTVESNPAVAAVVGITALALLVRLALLGHRIAHFDEGRVGYWAIHFLETGEFHYRFIIHGPLMQFVDKWVFGLLGASDFTMRLPVALIGGLLPATVLLYREHLRGSELVGTAVFLAFNPIVVYYSRFFRSTLPAIAFAFVAFGLLVRAHDTRKPRYVHGAVAFVALAFTAKENAAVYLLTWLGATALLLDHALFRPRNAETGVSAALGFWERYVRDTLLTRGGLRYVGHGVAGVLLFLAITFFFYSPRAGNAGGLGLWKTFANPGQFPALVDATVADVTQGYEYWFGGGIESGNRHDSIFDRYLTFLGVTLKALGEFAIALVVLSVLGFLVERYASNRPRNVVMFAAYWGFVSLLGFPLGSDIANAWITVNGLIPLAIPAGIGLALFYRWGRGAWDRDDSTSAALSGVILFLVVVSMASGMATGVYTNDQSDENPLVQYAQPADDLRPTIRDLRAAAADNEGTDVLFYGEEFTTGPDLDPGRPVNAIYPRCSKMVKTLPLQWYIAASDATSACAREANLSAVATDDPPPVIVADASDESDLSEVFPNYEVSTYRLRAFGSEAVFFVAPEYASTTDP